MRIVFRVDSSDVIGAGHIMRCLALSEALSARGETCHFIVRSHSGHLASYIEEKGYTVSLLELPNTEIKELSDTDYAAWLGVTQADDAEECIVALNDEQADWLIVDHYALDIVWEQQMRSHCCKLMVIDDLANRKHECDLLLDQTYKRSKENYSSHVSNECQLLCGTEYSLLRREFQLWRDFSLLRRQSRKLNNILVNMGGVDNDNLTCQVLQVLQNCLLPKGCSVTIVMGSTAPWAREVKRIAGVLPFTANVKIGVNNMAELMANCDLAIGAAGSTSWERCCLGLPTILLVVAENQREIAQALSTVRAVRFVDNIADIASEINSALDWMGTASIESSKIVDGFGADRVADLIVGNN
jgi:UDP-2,4-diacetamido-2,4,6-trideoxy-beta-L-altropyranose hydrolase